MSEITASPRSDISGNGGHRSGGDEIKTTCGEKKAESDEYETATEVLSEEGENSSKKPVFSPYLHHLLELWLSDRKVKEGEECDGSQAVKRRIKGVLRLRNKGNNSPPLQNSNTDEDDANTPEDNVSEREGAASEVAGTDSNDQEENGGQSMSSPSNKSPIHRAQNDVRRRYLTNLGIIPNQGGPPAIVRRPSFDSTRDPVVEEKLKDQKDSDMTLDDLVRVIKSLVGPGGAKDEASQARPDLCDACRDELQGLRGSSNVDDAQGESDLGCEYTCTHKRVKFSNTVAAIYVPTHQEYSNRVRQSYWAGVGEIREMVYRNMIEFDAEGYRWENVAEEPDMYYCEGRGEYIHPVFCDSEDNTATEIVDDGVGTAVFLNEGKTLPSLKQNEGIWA